MPRAYRHFLPDQVWHITHRCHKKEYLLRFARDRVNWIRWLFEARKRFGLCVLNYMVTCNHVHLLVKGGGTNTIQNSMQLVAGRTAQAYNRRKSRKGAFWEDRYHATAVQSDHHLVRCLVYVDLNMVRAGIVSHPEQWPHCGYHEIQRPPQRYRIIDHVTLLETCQQASLHDLQSAHLHWISEQLQRPDSRRRDSRWSNSIAVGGRDYVEEIQSRLGVRASGRKCIELESGYQLKEPESLYTAFLDQKTGFKAK